MNNSELIEEYKKFISFEKRLSPSSVKSYLRDINSLLKLNKNKVAIEKELAKRNIILYKSNDKYNYYWTLPLSKPNINDTIIDVLIYNNLMGT